MLANFDFQVTKDQVFDWAKWFGGLAKSIPHKKPSQWIAEHAEANRVMPAGTPFVGPLELSRSPYLIEPMNNMSPMSPVKRTGAMKAAQGGWSMGCIECPMCYYIGYAPADQLGLTAGEKTLKRWSSRRLEPAIDSYEYRKLISSQSTRKSNKNTGDSVFTKEYSGGQLDLATAESAPSLRSTDKMILYRDEIDGVKDELSTGEGNWLEVSEARTNFWGDRAKIMDISTPTLEGQSAIERIYLEGDQRVYMTPCPHCKKPQVLKFQGFKVDTEAGKLKDIYYQCDFCSDAIFEHHKLSFLPNGYWEPMKLDRDPYFRTYHWAAWLAPLGTITWEKIYTKYLEAKKSGKPSLMKTFVNLYLGKPYKQKGARPKVDKVIELRSSYKAGEVPDGVLFLTASVDVQRGTPGDKHHPPRLEMEVMGHGAFRRKWSIVHEQFVGEVDKPHTGAWAKLNEYREETGLIYKRNDGVEFPVKLMFLDSGDGTLNQVVYSFTQSWGVNTYPITGTKPIKQRKNEMVSETAVIDEMTRGNEIKFRIRRNQDDITIYQINTNSYKHDLYACLNIQKRNFGIQPPGLCQYPEDYTEKWFKMLTAEEKRMDGSFSAGGRRNEALDLQVYNRCAGDVYLGMLIEAARVTYKESYTPLELKSIINHRWVFEYLCESVGVKYE